MKTLHIKLTLEQHSEIKLAAFMKGKTIQDYVLDKIVLAAKDQLDRGISSTDETDPHRSIEAYKNDPVEVAKFVAEAGTEVDEYDDPYENLVLEIATGRVLDVVAQEEVEKDAEMVKELKRRKQTK